MRIKIKGIETLIYKVDLDLLRDYTWCLSTQGYLQAWVNGETRFLYHVIAERMGLDCSNDIDHIDQDPLNNQQENLRPATKSQNQANRGKSKNNTSGYKGVSWCKRDKKWLAQIYVGGKSIYLGTFDDKIEAARTYDRAALKYFGEFAFTNFPRSDYE